MTIDFVSPGPTGIPDVTIHDVSSVAQLKPHFFPRKVLESGAAQVFRPKVFKGIDLRVVVRGINVVNEHVQAFDALIPGAIWVIQNTTGQFMVQSARHLVPYLSGATHDSIHYVMSTSPGETMVSTGPTTFYAPFIEFGMGGHADIGPRPFMTDAMFRVIPHWYQAFRELAEIGAAGARGSLREDPYAPPVNAYLARWRKHLYSIEKRIGDVVPLGLGLGFLRGPRAGLINVARLLGDVQAFVGKTVQARIVRRLTGRATGRLIGFGSHTIFANRSMTTNFTFGQRIYNRAAGKAVTKYIDQASILGGGRFGL